MRRLPWALAAIAIATDRSRVALAPWRTTALSRTGHRRCRAAHLETSLALAPLSGASWQRHRSRLVIVILSQTAATSSIGRGRFRSEFANISRDFVGVGLANVAAGLVGAFPVDASPARTTVVAPGGRFHKIGRTHCGRPRDLAFRRWESTPTRFRWPRSRACSSLSPLRLIKVGPATKRFWLG
jgi:hypothetical protein